MKTIAMLMLIFLVSCGEDSEGANADRPGFSGDDSVSGKDKTNKTPGKTSPQEFIVDIKTPRGYRHHWQRHWSEAVFYEIENRDNVLLDFKIAADELNLLGCSKLQPGDSRGQKKLLGGSLCWDQFG